jgi:predicted transcriptional regulator
MTPGQYLREVRLEAGLSLRAAAEALEVSHVFLGECERGRSPVPDGLMSRLGRLFPRFDTAHYRALADATKPVRIDVRDKNPAVQRAAVVLSRLAKLDRMPDDLLTAMERALGDNKDDP